MKREVLEQQEVWMAAKQRVAGCKVCCPAAAPIELSQDRRPEPTFPYRSKVTLPDIQMLAPE